MGTGLSPCVAGGGDRLGKYETERRPRCRQGFLGAESGAIKGHHLSLRRLLYRCNPLPKAALKLLRVQQPKYPTEGAIPVQMRLP